jgi:hypothetical protein
MSQNIDLDLPMPTTTKEFAVWLHTLADAIYELPEVRLSLSDDDVEIGFYYDNNDRPSGLHFSVDYASTANLAVLTAAEK